MRTLSKILIGASPVAPAFAADHTEAPGAAADPAADIADYFAWVDGDAFVAVITAAALTPAGGEATYDPDVLYTVHVDQDGDLASDIAIDVCFGQNSAGDWGMQVTGIPGMSDPLVGPVETSNQAESSWAWAGLRDDPFFFDLTGFGDTLATGAIAFDASRDGLAGTNVTAIVIEAPADVITADAPIRTWATTARK